LHACVVLHGKTLTAGLEQKAAAAAEQWEPQMAPSHAVDTVRFPYQ
jgi:hypothetical protein